jgi:hypothetical protein
MPAIFKIKSEQYECWGDECAPPTTHLSHHFTYRRKNIEWIPRPKNKKIGQRWNDSRSTLFVEKFFTTTVREFKYLSAKWKKETGGYSLINQITKNKNYQYIIDMGEKVVPLIFKDLQNEPFYWFEALNQILKPQQDPILKKHYGNIDKMAQDWLKWGKEHNYLS